MLLSETIGVFENIFSVEECNLMIDRFESAKSENAGYKGESGAGLDYNVKRTYDYDLMFDDSRNYKWRDIILTRWNSTLTNEYLSKFPSHDLKHYNDLTPYHIFAFGVIHNKFYRLQHYYDHNFQCREI